MKLLILKIDTLVRMKPLIFQEARYVAKRRREGRKRKRKAMHSQTNKQANRLTDKQKDNHGAMPEKSKGNF